MTRNPQMIQQRQIFDSEDWDKCENMTYPALMTPQLEHKEHTNRKVKGGPGLLKLHGLGVGKKNLGLLGLPTPQMVCFGWEKKGLYISMLSGISSCYSDRDIGNFLQKNYYPLAIVIITKTLPEWFRELFKYIVLSPEQAEELFKQAQIGGFVDKFKPFGPGQAPQKKGSLHVTCVGKVRQPL